MGKFGKKVIVNTDMSQFMLGVMGPSGFGKSTLMYNVCEKQFGDDGYLLLDMGSENGTKAIAGVVAETVPNWKKMKEVVEDIVKNKDTDYPKLKVVILDTIDATYEIAEQFVVASFNKEHMGDQGFHPATSINSVEGGFGRGLDRTIDTVKKEIKRLNDVGVGVWWTSHVKERDQTDLFTGTAYTQLTASMSMKYFNSIKDISHVIGFGYYNRLIEKQEIDNTNPVTKKKKTREAVVSEDRMIKFRDDSMVADAKSRFADIVSEIPLDSDEFIKAISDAINAAAKKNGVKSEVVKNVAPAKPSEPAVEDTDLADEDDNCDVTVMDIKELQAIIRDGFKNASPDVKKRIKAILVECGSGKLDDSVPPKTLSEIKAILEEN